MSEKPFAEDDVVAPLDAEIETVDDETVTIDADGVEWAGDVINEGATPEALDEEAAHPEAQAAPADDTIAVISSALAPKLTLDDAEPAADSVVSFDVDQPVAPDVTPAAPYPPALVLPDHDTTWPEPVDDTSSSEPVYQPPTFPNEVGSTPAAAFGAHNPDAAEWPSAAETSYDPGAGAQSFGPTPDPRPSWETAGMPTPSAPTPSAPAPAAPMPSDPFALYPPEAASAQQAPYAPNPSAEQPYAQNPYSQAPYAPQNPYAHPSPGTMQSYPQASGMSPSEENTWATAAHWSALLGMFVGGLTFLGPLLVLLIQGPKSPRVRANAVESLNFEISFIIGMIASAILTMVIVGVIGLIVLPILWLVLRIVASVQTSSGRDYRYPVNIRLVK